MVTPVAFGTIDPMQNTPFFATGAITVTCTAGTSWQADADLGQNAGAINGTIARKMIGQTQASPSTMAYQLYIDSARAIGWNSDFNTLGSGGVVSASIVGLGTGQPDTKIIYGTIPAGQTNILADSYSDSVVVQITY